MPVNKGYSHILVLLCEVTNYMVALPLVSTRTPHILDTFQRGYLAYFGPPIHIMCDQDPAFTSSLMEAFVIQLNIEVILVSPTNHQSLQAEHCIKSLSALLVKHLSGAGIQYCLTACYATVDILAPISMVIVHMSWYLGIR